MSLNIDLHTHSVASPDGSITADEYRKKLSLGILDCIAVTDHNRIDFAQKLQSELGDDKIIIGEEVTTKQGDIIGLFLEKKISADQDIVQVIKEIKSQNGLVYIPHPFETVRKGISREILEDIRDSVDIIESANGRALFQNFGPEAHSWALRASMSTCASSDAHSSNALGKTFTTVDKLPSRSNLLTQLSSARLTYAKPSLLDVLAPKTNRVSKFLRGKKE